jgi:Listeria-Bacteroides repeat domain (List_Bact_rpt).
LSFTATASDGYLFSGWQGDLSGSSNPALLRLTKDVQVTALFEKKTYPLPVLFEQGGSVTEQVIQAKTEYEAGTVVRLTAIPDTGWEFVLWTGDAEGTEPRLDVTVTSAMTITAPFEKQPMPVSLTI